MANGLWDPVLSLSATDRPLSAVPAINGTFGKELQEKMAPLLSSPLPRNIFSAREEGSYISAAG